jgi:dTDP-4-dehydrorhamnose 3,5-epimerase
MKVIKTNIQDLYIIEPKVFEDERGYFFESYNQLKYKEAGIDIDFVQDNQSKSSFGVIRGLHYQLAPHAQTKLVRALEGTIWDIAVDIRIGSPTYGQWLGIELSADNKRQLLVPQGFAHGFSVLSPTAIVFYKCDKVYHPGSERGIQYNDPEMKIDWKISSSAEVLSAKDKKHLPLSSADNNFYFSR